LLDYSKNQEIDKDDFRGDFWLTVCMSRT
jgi:hypothetical protein